MIYILSFLLCILVGAAIKSIPLGSQMLMCMLMQPCAPWSGSEEAKK